MSYMRDKLYVSASSDGDQEYLRVNGESVMEMRDFDELAVMRLAQMTADEVEEAEHRAAARHGGNFGADALCRKLGLPETLGRLRI